MARKVPRKSSTEQIEMDICGLRPDGEAVSISVCTKGKAVRLSGPHGSHPVHPSNESSSDGWIREAILVWNLTDVYHEHPVYLDQEKARERFAALRAKGEELKRTLAAPPKKDS